MTRQVLWEMWHTFSKNQKRRNENRQNNTSRTFRELRKCFKDITFLKFKPFSTHSTNSLVVMEKRIFIHRALQMSRIKFIGFDMDATLAIYKSPASEELAFDLAKERLLSLGYPQPLTDVKYDPDFAMRGAWFDKKYGCLLKTDEHSNIMGAWFGFQKLKSSEIRQLYPNKHIQYDEKRIFILNTVFNTPEIYLLAAVVSSLERSGMKKLSDETGYESGSRRITFRTVFQDCRQTIDLIHQEDNSFKKAVVADLHKYIEQDPRAVPTMQALKGAGKTLFLLTNSGWHYTNALMSHVMGTSWRDLFDVVIVDGNKPSWFISDTPFIEIDPVTGCKHLGAYTGPLLKGGVYSGGSVDIFRQRLGVVGKDTLYVGDHIFGDALKSKQVGGWRTLLIVPELEKEISTWSKQASQFAELRKNLDIESDQLVKMKKISELTDTLESAHGKMGSIIRHGWKQTFYANKIRRYADLYTGNVYNLLNYPPTHYFHSPIYLLPHERQTMDVAPDKELSEAGVSPSEVSQLTITDKSTIQAGS